MFSYRKIASIVVFLGLMTGWARAADMLDLSPASNPASYKDAPGDYWIVTLGGYGGAAPVFPGSSSYDFAFRPIIDIYRAGAREWLTLPTDAFSFTLYQTQNFRAGLACDYLWNRNRSDDSALRGLPNIDYTLEGGVFAEYYPAPFLRTRLELLQGVTGADGFVANMMADYIFHLGSRWEFTAGPRLQFADTQYVSTFYSISGSELVLSGLPPFHASGGLNSAGIDATARYDVNENLSVRAFADWEKLTGDAADSPLVRFKGSADQFQFGIGAAYRFAYEP